MFLLMWTDRQINVPTFSLSRSAPETQGAAGWAGSAQYSFQGKTSSFWNTKARVKTNNQSNTANKSNKVRRRGQIQKTVKKKLSVISAANIFLYNVFVYLSNNFARWSFPWSNALFTSMHRYPSCSLLKVSLQKQLIRLLIDPKLSCFHLHQFFFLFRGHFLPPCCHTCSISTLTATNFNNNKKKK